MRRFLPITAPPLVSIVLPLILLLMFDALIVSGFVYQTWRFGGVGYNPLWEALGELKFFQTFHSVGAVAFAVFFGLYRVGAFHPVLRPDYLEWIKTTPWTSRLPLPLGPIHLVWHDALFVAGATLVAAGPDIELMLTVPLMFLVAYVVALLPTLFLTNERLVGYGVIALAGMAIRLAIMARAPVHALVEPQICLAWCFVPVVAMAALVTYGLHRSLARSKKWRELAFLDGVSGARSGPPRLATELGWPFDKIGPKSRVGGGEESLHLARHLAEPERQVIAVLCGWLLWVSASPLVEHERNHLAIIAGTMFFSPMLMACGAWIVCRPPISFWGRVRTGHWIIRGYDRLYLWPLITMGVQCASLVAILVWGWPSIAVIPLQTSATVWCWLRASTFFDRYQFTGWHSIPIPFTNGTARVSA